MSSSVSIARCHQLQISDIDVFPSTRPPAAARPTRLHSSPCPSSTKSQSIRNGGSIHTTAGNLWKRSTSTSDVIISNGVSATHAPGYRSRLITACVSGQRSPTSPDSDEGMFVTADGNSSYLCQSAVVATSGAQTVVSANKPRQASPYVSRRPPPSTKSASVPSSTRSSVGDYVEDTSSGMTTADLEPSAYLPSAIDQAIDNEDLASSRTDDSIEDGIDPPLAGAAPLPRGRTREVSVSQQSDRKRVGDRSPAALWRSISSSSLVRSLSRRRSSAKKNFRSGQNSDDGRSKQSSADTEDSDADILDSADFERRQRRRTFAGVDSGTGSESGGSGQDDRGGERSADLPPTGSSANSKPPRRRSFFSRPFRRSRSTPAEEFVLMTTDGVADRKPEKAEAETTKRFRSPRRRNSGKSTGAVSGQPSTLSSRASSLASLKRSQTADNLTSVKDQLTASMRNGDTGTNDIVAVAVLRLTSFMVGKWISAMAVNSSRHELTVVDFRSAYVVDISSSASGRLIKVIGSKNSGGERLVEPIGVSALCATPGGGGDSRLVFTDHADQSVKIYSGRGHYIRSVDQLGLSNVGGVAVHAESGDIYVAGTDSRRVVVCRKAAYNGNGQGEPSSSTSNAAFLMSSRPGYRKRQQETASDGPHVTQTPVADGPLPVLFQHPYSLAVNPTNGDVLVGDDYAQQVVAVCDNGQAVRWRWVPPKPTLTPASDSEFPVPGSPAPHRPFFPSSICATTSGHVFVADLYNERVYLLDCSPSGATNSTDVDTGRVQPPDCSEPLLTRRTGLRGGPLALALDETRRHLFVADEERTVRVFCYSAAIVAGGSRSRCSSIRSVASISSPNCVSHARLNSELQQQRQQQQQQQRDAEGHTGHMLASSRSCDRPFSYLANDVEQY